MSNEAKTEYLNSIREEYRKASRREKAVILRHAELVTGLTRKRIIRRLSQKESGKTPRRPGRRPRFGEECLKPLKDLWFLMEQPCGKRLKILLPKLLPGYQKRFPGVVGPETEGLLLEMSPATIDRLLKRIKVQKGIATTKAPTSRWYRSVVPVRPKDWSIIEPGHAQADTVSHCGESGAGTFASTLTVTDVDSHWTELRATLTKKHTGIVDAIRDIEKGLPFRLKSLHFDSGSEFMNYAVVSFCRGYGPSFGREKPIEVLRSRPYRKNDNCYVEQKNLTHVREFIGYDRIESADATRLLNELYREAWCPLLNFFMPTFKLIRKERVGSKIKKTYETPKTPYDRLLESEAISPERKAELKARYATLDPFELKERAERMLQELFGLIRSEEKQDEALKLSA